VGGPGIMAQHGRTEREARESRIVNRSRWRRWIIWWRKCDGELAWELGNCRLQHQPSSARDARIAQYGKLGQFM